MINSARAVALLSLFALLPACGTQFDVAENLQSETVQGHNPSASLSTIVPDPLLLNIDLAAQTQERGSGPAKHAYPKSLVLKARSAGAFDFVSQVSISLDAASDASLPKIVIATLDHIPQGATELTFTVKQVDILKYLQAAPRLTADASGAPPENDFVFDGIIVIDVRA